MASFLSLIPLALGVLVGSAACQHRRPLADKSTSLAASAPKKTKGAEPRQPAAAPELESSEARAARIAAPDGFIRMTVGGIAPTSRGNAVLLVDEGKKLGIPIFIGQAEALSIQLRLEKRHYDRPLTHDLLDSMMGKLGGRVESVRVDKYQNNIYFGTVIVVSGARRIELDSRSSDAVALAVGNDAPIFVARQVVDRNAVALEEMESHAHPSNEPEVPVEETTRPAFTL